MLREHENESGVSLTGVIWLPQKESAQRKYDSVVNLENALGFMKKTKGSRSFLAVSCCLAVTCSEGHACSVLQNTYAQRP